jgi:hypothetical protein
MSYGSFRIAWPCFASTSPMAFKISPRHSSIRPVTFGSIWPPAIIAIVPMSSMSNLAVITWVCAILGERG